MYKSDGENNRESCSTRWNYTYDFLGKLQSPTSALDYYDCLIFRSGITSDLRGGKKEE